jgi:hypothetical protein
MDGPLNACFRGRARAFQVKCAWAVGGNAAVIVAATSYLTRQPLHFCR